MVWSNISLAADSTEVAITANQLRDLAQALDDNADRDLQRRQKIRDQIDSLECLVKSKEISIDSAKHVIEKLDLLIKAERETVANIASKHDQIEQNYNKYVFKTRAQKIVPFLYAAAAVFIADGEVADKILYGLAGYGAGSLVENTGYGISAGIAFLLYRF
ncbi:hypothetical protein Ctha_1216 [Chloroherpeton thalassium ATCC 35110]|uniref:Uncharacterized protein n=1 Tax=Chloroherpeton thalassium (strain ATCC 35110 / GB-78) TaxID=517418 RepID=B3QYY7_CHLT3|nr:hypothetical protein [Chloroherpeton thalassium]ACF13680.1 hypothetical protein Ctha_1216 [Chloroherpeton thalassium ATCC 35110]